MSDQDAVEVVQTLEHLQLGVEGAGGDEVLDTERGRPAAADLHDELHDDFGDFADSAPLQNQNQVLTAPDRAAAASATISTGSNTVPAASAATDEAFDDDFGDFESSSGAPAVPVPQIAAGTQPTQLSATASTSLPAASEAAAPPAAAPAAAAVVEPPPPTAAPELPDILQLSGSDFLQAVLDTWQVLGAPAAYAAAAAAQQPPIQHVSLGRQQPAALQAPPHSVFAHNGIPMFAASSNTGDLNLQQVLQQQQYRPVLPVPVVSACDADLDAVVSEERLVAALGLTQAVERAIAQLERDEAAALRVSGTGTANNACAKGSRHTQGVASM